jgi:hypothetical protein
MWIDTYTVKSVRNHREILDGSTSFVMIHSFMKQVLATAYNSVWEIRSTGTLYYKGLIGAMKNLLN